MEPLYVGFYLFTPNRVSCLVSAGFKLTSEISLQRGAISLDHEDVGLVALGPACAGEPLDFGELRGAAIWRVGKVRAVGDEQVERSMVGRFEADQRHRGLAPRKDRCALAGQLLQRCRA